MRKRGRTDANHTEIVAALRQAGAFVQSLASIGDGCPDLLVARRHPARPGQRLYLLEVKTDKGELTPDEITWRDAIEERAGVAVYVVRSAEDALRVVGAIA